MASIGLIAEKLCLSKTAVSNALRNSGKVSEATRRKVFLAAKKMGYVANTDLSLSATRLSRGLREKTPPRKTHIANLVFFRQNREHILSVPYYKQVSDLLHASFRQNGTTLLDCYPQDEEEFVRVLSGNASDGTLILSSVEKIEMNLLPFLEHYAMASPLIFVSNYPGENGKNRFHSVQADNISMGRMAADYFLSRGIRCLFFVDPMFGTAIMTDRYRGFRLSAEEAGLAPERIEFKETSQNEWSADINPVLQSTAPAGFVCGNDHTALHFHDYLLSRAALNPSLHHFAGLDGIPAIAKEDIREITVKLDIGSMVNQTCHLFDDISNQTVTGAQKILIGSEIISRPSTQLEI